MNNNSYVFISMDKLETIIETSCPPVAITTQAYICTEYDGDCKECWKAWLTESEDNHE